MKRNNLLLEACVETIEEALLAQKNGAQRIELCAHLELGGLTPPRDLITAAKQSLDIPIMVIIRPVAGGFVYTSAELEEMKSEIEFCKRIGVTGVVLGILNPQNEIDIEQTKELAALSYPLSVSFHKAIDETSDPVNSARLLMEVPNLQRILSSGGAPTALEGKEVLKKMIAATGDSITILVAGKVTKDNLAEVHREIGTREYHGRRIVF